MVNTLKRNKLFLAAILVLFSASFSFAAKQNTYTTKTAPTGSDKALIADAADSNKTKQAALSFALTGDCTGFPCLDGTSDGGNMIKLWAGTGSYWTALQGGAPAANRSWRLPIAAPPSAGTTYLMNMDEYGQMGFVDPATFLTPSGVGGSLTVTATGFNGNLTTSDNTLQEIAQKVDDLVLGGTDTDDQTASEVAVTSSGFDGNLATTDNTVQKALQKLDDLTVTGGTDDQTASEVNITDAGLYFTGTTVEAALQEVGLDYAKKVNYLALANTTAFTPDADYEPATKKYVDDSIVAGGSYTDEQAQDAVGGMFSGNTETGITVTYDDATGKVNLDASHNHTGTYAPVLGSDDNYVTDAEKTKLTNLSGTNSGDNAVNSNYASLVTNATHTGDVTGATALTIANSAVTLAKMANMATGSLIYRKTASSGAPEVNTLATLKTDLGLTGTNSGDQTATTTAFTPNGTIAATTVQAAIQEVRDEAGGSFDPASPGAIGGTTPAAGTFTTIGAGAGGFTVDADGDLIAKSIGTTRSATIGSIFDLYEGSNNGDNKVTIQPSAALSVDKTIVAENILQTTDVDTSAKLRAIVTDESGTGALFFAGGDVAAATATTPSANDNDTSIATTAYVQTEIAATASDSLTLTNKTLDTAGTGNAITVPLNGVLDGAITDPADADDMIYARAANAMTVTGIDCQAEGTTPSITVTLQKCNDLACGTPTAIEAAITCDADGGVHASTIDSASISADTPIKVLFGAPSGTVNSVRWRVIGTQTW